MTGTQGAEWAVGTGKAESSGLQTVEGPGAVLWSFDFVLLECEADSPQSDLYCLPCSALMFFDFGYF